MGVGITFFGMFSGRLRSHIRDYSGTVRQAGVRAMPGSVERVTYSVILSGLRALLDNPGMQSVTHGLQAGCRDLIGCILHGVPVRIVEVDQIDGRNTSVQKGRVIIEHRKSIVGNELTFI